MNHINTFIQQVWITIIKGDNKGIYRILMLFFKIVYASNNPGGKYQNINK